MNPKLIKGLSLVAMLGGGALSMLSGWVDKQQMKQTIKEEVEKATKKN